MLEEREQIQEKEIYIGKEGHKQFEFDHAKIIVEYPAVIYNNSKILTAVVKLIPKQPLLNSPLEVELRGFSYLKSIKNKSDQEKGKWETTESELFENDEKMKANLVMVESKYTERKKEGEEETKSQNIHISNDDEGQYFLEGCLVLYQRDEKTQERLDILTSEIEYQYPIQFMLPPQLPVSLSHVLLKNMHFTIRYTLQVKIVCAKKNGKSLQDSAVIQFQLQEAPKIYPYEELVLAQKVRCYHENGKKQDILKKTYLSKMLRFFCPLSVFNYYQQRNNMVKTHFEDYDLFHIELLAVVSRDQNMFLTIRAYQDPQQDQLIINRERAPSKSLKKEETKLSEINNDLSVVAIKQPQLKKQFAYLTILRVNIEMYGEIKNICKQKIFSKTIHLNNSNYDMLEGEIMIQLGDYLNYPKTCHNQLFNLEYSFKMAAIFTESQEVSTIQFQEFVVEEKAKELHL